MPPFICFSTSLIRSFAFPFNHLRLTIRRQTSFSHIDTQKFNCRWSNSMQNNEQSSFSRCTNLFITWSLCSTAAMSEQSSMSLNGKKKRSGTSWKRTNCQNNFHLIWRSSFTWKSSNILHWIIFICRPSSAHNWKECRIFSNWEKIVLFSHSKRTTTVAIRQLVNGTIFGKCFETIDKNKDESLSPNVFVESISLSNFNQISHFQHCSYD